MAFLQLITPKSSKSLPSMVELDQDEMLVGRKKNCHIVLADDTLIPKMISRLHARITRKLQNERLQWTLTDNNSTNGCLVNSTKISTQALAHGDMVHFGGGTGVSVGEKQCKLDHSQAVAYVFQEQWALREVGLYQTVAIKPFLYSVL